MKKILSISIFFIAFGLLLSHELIPHHHHEIGEFNMHDHDHNGEEQSHNILKCFFSLLHHSDLDNLVLINSSVNNELVKSNLPSSILPFTNHLYQFEESLLKQADRFCFIPSERIFLESFSFRGPPLV